VKTDTKHLRELCAKAPGYAVSRDGRVFSLVSNWRGYGERELATGRNSDGYASVRVMIDGRRKQLTVHRLVADAFLGPRPSPTHQVRHLDGDRMNPSAANLAWGTAKENAEDRDRHGTTAIGDRNGTRTKPESIARGTKHGMFGRPDLVAGAKLTFEIVTEIKHRIASGESQSAIARSLGVRPSTVNRVANQKAWRTP